jgi:hypothetical protein
LGFVLDCDAQQQVSRGETGQQPANSFEIIRVGSRIEARRGAQHTLQAVLSLVFDAASEAETCSFSARSPTPVSNTAASLDDSMESIARCKSSQTGAPTISSTILLRRACIVSLPLFPPGVDSKGLKGPPDNCLYTCSTLPTPPHSQKYVNALVACGFEP